MVEPRPGAAGGLALVGVGRRFGDVEAVDSLDLVVAPGSFTALLGPSGCGKSTTLAMVAGLLEPSEGDVLLDGRSLLGVPAEKRPVSLVFQKPLLFPHLTVEQNVGFGLRMQRRTRPEIRREVGGMLERVRLDGLGGRRVDQLSGGQEQRVSLARALVLRPRLLLLDEPFSQLDADLRREMRSLVRDLHDESDLTTLFVTHDHDEAVELADRIALMVDGRSAGQGAPEDFYVQPPTLAAARFFGSPNEIEGHVAAGRFRVSDGTVDLPCGRPDGAALLVIRPESVVLGGPVPVTVSSTRFAGTHLVVDVTLSDGQPLRCHVAADTRIAAGDRVGLLLPEGRCSVFGAGAP